MKVEEFKQILVSLDNDDRYPPMFSQVAFERFVMAVQIHGYFSYEQVENLKDKHEAYTAIMEGLVRMHDEVMTRLQDMAKKLDEASLGARGVRKNENT